MSARAHVGCLSASPRQRFGCRIVASERKAGARGDISAHKSVILDCWPDALYSGALAWGGIGYLKLLRRHLLLRLSSTLLGPLMQPGVPVILDGVVRPARAGNVSASSAI